MGVAVINVASSFSIRVGDALKIVLYSKEKGISKHAWLEALGVEDDAL